MTYKLKIRNAVHDLESIDLIGPCVRKALGLKGPFIIEMESDLLSGTVSQSGNTVASFKIDRGGARGKA